MTPQSIETWGVTQKAWVAAQVGLGITQQVLSNCIGHHCWLLVLSFPFWVHISSLVVAIIINNKNTNIT